jgi:hypothetical protein
MVFYKFLARPLIIQSAGVYGKITGQIFREFLLAHV